MRITGFEICCNLLKEKAGLLITQEHSYLLDSRLSPIAKKWGYTSVESLAAHLQIIPERQLVQDVIESMVQRDSSFFRDIHPFETLRDLVIPYAGQKRKFSAKPLRIWSAGAANGQEPISIAITMREHAPALRASIFATDISGEAIQMAQANAYSRGEVQRGISTPMLLQHFTQIDPDKWKANQNIHSMIEYHTHNLMDGFDDFGTFDIIFCRYVLRHFDPAFRAKTLRRLSKSISKDGFLFLGENEDIKNCEDILKPFPHVRDIYVRVDGSHN
jgi:chemotaxis protein methyltransferase CheR